MSRDSDTQATDAHTTDAQATDAHRTDPRPTDARPTDVQPTDVQPTDVQPPTEILPGFWEAGTPVDWDWVRTVGFQLIIDVNDADQVHEPDDVAGLRYVKHPLHDQGELPDVHLLDELVGLVVEAVRSNRPVLVHCGFGKNRSGLVVTLAVRELLGVDGRTALAHVRHLRHRAVNNETFAAYLESLPAPELIGG